MAKRKHSFHFMRKKCTGRMKKKLVVLFFATILAFTGLLIRITVINAQNGAKYSQIVLDQQQYDSSTIPYKRGDILDRNGTVLATSEKRYNVILDVKVMLTKEENVEPTIAVLRDVFGIDENEVRSLIEESPDSSYSILLKGISYDKAQEFQEISENTEEYPNVAGIWLEENYVRSYPNGSLACDVIGFTVDGNIGNNGIEAYYNSELNGTNGREYGYLDGESVGEQVIKDAVNGNNVVSTIDANLQSIVEKHIKAFNEAHADEAQEGTGSQNTAVIIMDPNSGEILAEASYPDYDLNQPRDLSAYYSEEELAAMSDEETIEALTSLWKNFCVSETYEPGSTIKPFTVAAGLESGAIDGTESYYCGGSLYVGGETISCHETSGHGTETVQDAIADSCNVSLMQIAEAIGTDDFSRYQGIFGFGQYTNIDLPGEASTAALLYSASEMKASDLATNSFGQNFNVTMTQMVAGFASLINGGNYYQPHVVKEIQDEDGNVLESYNSLLIKRTVSEETSEKIRAYTRAVVEEGTGTNVAIEGYDIGGKTGTAEKLPRGNGCYVLSFIGYAPVDNPEILIYVVIDEPNVEAQDTSSYVTNLSREIMEEVFPYLGITKQGE